jgi:Family of unknown function (DUF6152)
MFSASNSRRPVDFCRNRKGKEGLSMTIQRYFISAAAVLLAAAIPAAAHHSFAAEFDANQPVTVRGAISKMDWVNPHMLSLAGLREVARVKLRLDVPGPPRARNRLQKHRRRFSGPLQSGDDR